MNIILGIRSLMVIVFLLVFGGIILSANKPMPADNNTTTITHGMNDSDLKAEFDRIAELPYSEYQCRQKSDLLLEYIHQHDLYSKVYTISIPHKSGAYSHVFVEYEGVIFDPTSSPPLYRQSWDKYNQNLKIWGFTDQSVVSQGYNGVYN